MPAKVNSTIENEIKFLIQDIGEIEEDIENNFSLADCSYDSSKLKELIDCLNDLISEKTDGDNPHNDIEDELLFSLGLHQITVEEIVELIHGHCNIG